MMAAVGVQPPRRAGADRQGDPLNRDEVLSSVYRRHYQPLVGLARLLLDDRGQAEEVVQEAFARTYDGWRRVRTPDDPLPYVRRAVMNLARGGLRRRVVARRYRPDPRPEVAAAEAGALRAESDREVMEAVRALPRRQREVVLLRFYLDCSTAEAAASLGISDGAVKTHLHRALAALAPRLEEFA
jgi:RNA polymerase sigma-70 factor (sigma-E family)